MFFLYHQINGKEVRLSVRRYELLSLHTSQLLRAHMSYTLSSLLKGSAWQAASEWLYVVPWGIHKVLNYIAQRYNNPPIYITENGMHGQTFLSGKIILLFQCNMIFHPRCSFINGHPLKKINFWIRIGYYRTFCILSMVSTNIISISSYWSGKSLNAPLSEGP